MFLGVVLPLSEDAYTLSEHYIGERVLKHLVWFLHGKVVDILGKVVGFNKGIVPFIKRTVDELSTRTLC